MYCRNYQFDIKKKSVGFERKPQFGIPIKTTLKNNT